jgi:hypothetical protein
MFLNFLGSLLESAEDSAKSFDKNFLVGVYSLFSSPEVSFSLALFSAMHSLGNRNFPTPL